MERNWCAVVTAAGRGQRFGRPKQFIEIAGKPMVAWSIETFSRMPEVAALVVTAERDYVEAMQALAERHAPRFPVRVACGGATRQASVRAALAHVPPQCSGVFVHDGARPLVRAADVREGMRAVRPGRASLLAVPVVDTIKVVDGRQTVRRTLVDIQRQAGEGLWAAQTPQFATAQDMLRAHDEALRAGVEATDDAALLERIGLEVVVVPSLVANFKVTHPWDQQRAETLLRMRALEEGEGARELSLGVPS